MLDAVSTTPEYLHLVKDIFSVLSQLMLSLFSSASYLLVGNGSNEPEAQIWRWITVSEISSITFTNTIPLQSNRLYTIFIQLTVIDICIILYRNYGDILLIVKKLSLMLLLLLLNRLLDNSFLIIV